MTNELLEKLENLKKTVDSCKDSSTIKAAAESVYSHLKREPQAEDNVNHPKHYTSHPSGIECINITRHYCFSIGNAIKYLWRAGLKKEMGVNDVCKEIEDLNKAIWYIKDRIKQLEYEIQETPCKASK